MEHTITLQERKVCIMKTESTARQGGEKQVKTHHITVSAMLSALAFVLMYIEISVPIMPAFVKFDFSDLPALLGAFALGPIYGVIIELVKNLLHLIVSQSMFIGELSNFILGAVFTFIAGFIYRLHKTKRMALIAGLSGAVIMGIVSIFSNLFIVYPVYVSVYFGGDVNVCISMYQAIVPMLHLDSLLSCLLIFNLPFTIVKGIIDVLITFAVYKKISPIIKSF